MPLIPMKFFFSGNAPGQKHADSIAQTRDSLFHWGPLRDRRVVVNAVVASCNQFRFSADDPVNDHFAVFCEENDNISGLNGRSFRFDQFNDISRVQDRVHADSGHKRVLDFPRHLESHPRRSISDRNFCMSLLIFS